MKTPKVFRSAVVAVSILGGAACLVTGAYEVYHPAGWIVAGLMLFGVAAVALQVETK